MHKNMRTHMHMATNIELNEQLLKEVMKLGGIRTKKEAVNEAIPEHVQRREHIKIIDGFGKVESEVFMTAAR